MQLRLATYIAKSGKGQEAEWRSGQSRGLVTRRPPVQVFSLTSSWIYSWLFRVQIQLVSLSSVGILHAYFQFKIFLSVIYCVPSLNGSDLSLSAPCTVFVSPRFQGFQRGLISPGRAGNEPETAFALALWLLKTKVNFLNIQG